MAMTLHVVVLIVMVVSVAALSTMPCLQRRTVGNVGGMEMKRKGKKVSIQDRGEYMKRKRIIDARNANEMANGGDDDSVPTFEVHVRHKAGGLWVPAGNLKGDNRATALCNACMGGFMTDMYRGQLNAGVARSIMANRDNLAQGLIENYKPFSKLDKDDIIFGFKVKYEGWEEKVKDAQKVTALTPGMERSWQDDIKDNFNSLFRGKK